MIFRPYYLACLAHASYLIGDGGEAIVIDPQRDVDAYIEDAAAAGLKIQAVVETHLHADFVSGHVELARRTGAKVYVSHLAKAEYPHEPVREGSEIQVGSLVLKVIETPGHTPESISLVLHQDGAPTHLFSGDTLFIGEIGRPDLAGWRGYSRDELAHQMYRTLREKILPLPDSVEVWPAHGAGSACGKAISSEPTSLLGRQKRENWGLRMAAAGDEEGFVSELTSGLPTMPPYFPHDVVANRKGSPPLRVVIAAARPLSASVLDEEVLMGTVVLDTRSPYDFGCSHIPGSLNVGLDGKFAPWAGVVVPTSSRLIVVTDPGREVEALMRLARVGYEHVVGWLEGGMEAWVRMDRWVSATRQVNPDEVAEAIAKGEPLNLLDVRTMSEWEEGHLKGALHIPLLDLEAKIDKVPPGPLTVFCHSGYRSSIACSLLESRGRSEVSNLDGGWDALSCVLQGQFVTA